MVNEIDQFHVKTIFLSFGQRACNKNALVQTVRQYLYIDEHELSFPQNKELNKTQKAIISFPGSASLQKGLFGNHPGIIVRIKY